MNLFGLILLNNRRNKYAIVDINERLQAVYNEAYKECRNEAVYATYRAITGATVQESWRYCKPLIKEWEGKK